MKKSFLFAISAVILGSCSTQPKYVVEGDIAGLEGAVYMFEGDSLVDSTAVKAGKFRFEGIAGKPSVRRLADTRQGASRVLGAHFYVEPGTISVRPNTNILYPIRVTGTPANDAADQFIARMDDLLNEYRDQSTSEEPLMEFVEKNNKIRRDAIQDNRDNLFGVRMFGNQIYFLSGEELLVEIAKFSPEMQQTKEMEEVRAAAHQKMKTDVGQPYINIMQSGSDGQIITLSSVIENKANKFTLVDFWTSGCIPCMDELPDLKRTYDEYHARGFEIYGISLDSSKEDWLAAVNDRAMNWIHVWDLKGAESPAAKDYAVSIVPSNFLIDSEGRIIAQNLRGEEVYKKIEELLQ